MEDPDPDPSGPAAAFERFEERLAAMEATSASLAASVAALLARLDGAAEERHPAEQAGSLRLPIIMLAGARDALVSSPAACRALEVASLQAPANMMIGSRREPAYSAGCLGNEI